MPTLQEMYQEEREHHSVRESIRRVGARTDSEPASVARRLGFDPTRLPVGPVVAGPASARQEGRCNIAALSAQTDG